MFSHPVCAILIAAISSVSFDGSDMEKHNQQGKHGMLDHAGEEGAEAMTKPLEQEVLRAVR